MTHQNAIKVSRSNGPARAIRASFIAACGAVLLAEALGLAGLAAAPHLFLALNPNAYHPFFAYAVGGIFAIHAMAGAPRDIGRAGLLGCLLLAVHGVVLGYGTYRFDLFLGFVIYYLGVGSALVLMFQSARRGERDAEQSPWLLLMAGMTVPLLVFASRTFLGLSYFANPLTLDALVFHFDRSLGFHPSALAAHFVRNSEPLLQMLLAVYAALPLMIAIAAGTQLRHRGASVNVLLVFMAIAVLGFPIYFLYPVTGPVYAFGTLFPDHVPALAEVPLMPLAVGAVPRNGMPSLHFAWTVALWLCALNEAPWVRRGIAVFAVLTAVATLGLGEHYLIDLIVALPLAVAVQAMFFSGDSGVRRQAFGGGISLLAGWLLYLTFGSAVFAAVGLAHWLPIGLTVFGTVWFGYRLAR